MKNTKAWIPTKFVKKGNSFVVSRKEEHVSAFSRLMAKYVIDFYAEVIPRYAHGNLYDLGCGNVPLFEVYKVYVDQICCVDWPNSLHKAKHLDLEADLSKPLEVDSRSADTVILSDVLEHIYKPEVTLGEANRILRPGGCLILNVPFLYWIHEQPHDFFRYTEYALSKLVQDAGFEIVELKRLGGSIDVVSDQLSKMVWRVPIFGKSLSRLLQNISMRFSATKFCQKLSRVTEQHSPLAYGLVAMKK